MARSFVNGTVIPEGNSRFYVGNSVNFSKDKTRVRNGENMNGKILC